MMERLSARRCLLFVLLVASGCGFGIGRTSSAHVPARNVSSMTMVTGDELKDSKGRYTGWVEVLGFREVSWGNYTRGFFGVHLATALGRVRSSPGGMPTSSGWMFTQHVTGVLGVGAYALQLEWQQRSEHFNYDRGFGGEMTARGLVGWLGYSPVGFAGLSLGYGKLDDATLGFGSESNRTLYGSVPATGSYYGLAIDTFVAGGALMQWGIRPRLLIGYASVEPAQPMANLPTSYGGLSVSFEAILTVF